MTWTNYNTGVTWTWLTIDEETRGAAEAAARNGTLKQFAYDLAIESLDETAKSHYFAKDLLDMSLMDVDFDQLEAGLT